MMLVVKSTILATSFTETADAYCGFHELGIRYSSRCANFVCLSYISPTTHCSTYLTFKDVKLFHYYF